MTTIAERTGTALAEASRQARAAWRPWHGVAVALVALVALVAPAALVLAGCGESRPPTPPAATTSTSPPTATPTPSATRAPRPRVRRARCPAGTPGCAAVRGRVVYVERVDPDGDGDLHVVVLAGHVTAPGATAIDIAADLRPPRDPRIGDLVSAAGPVQRGHLRQAQIHALVFHVARR